MAFDKISNGFQKGELIVIGGRPGMRKTQFMVQIAVNIAKQNLPVAFLSMELSSKGVTAVDI